MQNWIQTLTHYSRQHPLGYRILLSIGQVSFVFILCSTALQLSLDYRRELQSIDRQVELIRSSYLASLAKSLWDLDQAQVELQLLGIKTLPDLIHLRLLNTHTDGQLQLPNRPPAAHAAAISSHRFQLIHTTANQQQHPLGELEVSFDLHAVVARVWRAGLSTLLTQSLLVLLIVGVILTIVQRQITRHLESMAQYSRKIGAGAREQRLELDRTQPQHPDELDQLATALNDMGQAVQHDRDLLQQRVEQRTASLRRARDAAEDANRAKSQFLATMSHEIRTPMNGMLGMIQLLEGSPLSAQQQQQVQVLHDATQSLVGTFDHLLQYGKLEEGGWVIEENNFSLIQLINGLTALLRPSAEQKRLQLEVSLPPELATRYYGAEACIRQILTNLLNNAIKFTDKGQVHLHCSLIASTAQQHRLRLTVQDSGIGIAPELQTHIFDRFAQADNSITRRFGGTGLGLAICRQLTDALGGHIGVTSQPDTGSTFWLELPLALSDHTDTTNPHTNSPALTPLTLLLVEDVAINQQVVTGLLAPQKHQITVASTGYEALHYSQQQKFDVILMDMHLPGLSGLDISQRIRQDSSNPNHTSPIIALTASVREEDRQRYQQAGLEAVVAKPVQEHALLQALQRYSGVPATTNPPLTAPGDILTQHRQSLGDTKVRQLLRALQALVDQLWPEIHTAIAQHDTAQWQSHAHKLAGACEMLGFISAGELLRQLEDSPQVSDNLLAELHQQIPLLHTTLAATIQHLDATRQGKTS